MSDAKAILKEIIAHFATAEEGPGGWWAHDDDLSSYCLDHQARDGTRFWLDLEEDGTICLLWRPAGKPAVSVRFGAVVGSPSGGGK